MPFSIFKLDGSFDWKRLHCLIKRERRRLEEGLPIYAFRWDVLHAIHSQQLCSITIFGSILFSGYLLRFSILASACKQLISISFMFNMPFGWEWQRRLKFKS